MLEWLTKWEPVWLLGILSLETLVSLLIYRMSKIEFDYDKEWNERKAARRKKHLQFEYLTDGESK